MADNIDIYRISNLKKVMLITPVFVFFVMSCLAVNPNDWNLNDLNTAANSSYLSDFEKEMILEINMLRTNPAKYARDFILPLKNKYRQKLLYYPGDKPLLTIEGAPALDECLKSLYVQNKLPVLKPESGLSKAARDHVKDQSVTGKTGHKGGDGSNFRKRIERYGKWKYRIAENIAYGGISARQILIYLLIDDGIPDRGHRKNFLNGEFNVIGVATGRHPEYSNMSVMEFAAGFESSGF